MRIYLFLLFTLLFLGCASKSDFNNTPIKNQEFNKDFKTLKNKYSDIEKYDRFFSSPVHSSPVKELTLIWGESKVEKNWLEYSLYKLLDITLISIGYPIFAIDFILNPYPQKTYIWEKGKYEIKVEGRNDAFVSYEERIFSWEWEEKK